MKIYFNGELREVAASTTIAALLEQCDLEPQYVAVEVNCELVPRQRHRDYVLKAEDRLEVVTLVGGG